MSLLDVVIAGSFLALFLYCILAPRKHNSNIGPFGDESKAKLGRPKD